MKRKTKNALSLILLIFLCSLFLWNCEQEEQIEHQTSQLSTIKNIERHLVSLSMLEKTNSLAYNILAGLSKENPSDFSRNQDIYSEEYDLYYNLDEIYIIEEEHYQQYSFLVKSSNQLENQFENYILIQYPDDTFRQYVITYQYNSPDRDSYDNINIRELEGSQLFTRSISSCPNLPQLTPVTIEVCTYSNCTGTTPSGAYGTHSYGDLSCQCNDLPNCDAPSKDCETSVQWVMTCPGGGSNDNPDDCRSVDCEDNTNGGGANGGTGGDPDDNDIPVIPIEINYAQEIIDCMNIGDLSGATNYLLSPSEQNWINSAVNREIIPLYNFLLPSNSCDPSARELSFFVLDAFLNSQDPDVSLEAIFRLFNGFTKVCHAELMYKALEINSPFVNTFRNDLVNALDNNIAIQDLPANQIPGNINSAVTFYRLTSTPEYNDIVMIVFEEGYLNNASDLALITTLYHEMVHATMVDLYHEGKLLDNYPNYTSLNTAFDNYFENSSSQNDEILNKEMHDVFIDFIDPIAESIHKYCQENNISSVDLAYAKKLVWGSLGAYDIFTENLTPTEQTEALNLLNNEQQNNNDAVSEKTCD